MIPIVKSKLEPLNIHAIWLDLSTLPATMKIYRADNWVRVGVEGQAFFDKLSEVEGDLEDIEKLLDLFIKKNTLSTIDGLPLTDGKDISISDKYVTKDSFEENLNKINDKIDLTFTLEDKDKLNSIEEGATKVIVDSLLNTLSSNAIQNKVVSQALYDLKDEIPSISHLATKLELNLELSKKLNTLVLGVNISLTLNPSGTVTISSILPDTSKIEKDINLLKLDINLLIGESASEAIDRFNEILSFLLGIVDTETLLGLLINLKDNLELLIDTKVDKEEGKALILESEILRLATLYNYDDSLIKIELNNKANKTDVYTRVLIDNKGFLTEHLSLDAYSTTELMNIAIENAVSTKANSLDVYTKTETDLKLEEKLNISDYTPTDLSNYYNKEEIDSKFSSIDFPEIDLSNYYTKSEVDEAILNASTGEIDLSEYAKTADVNIAILEAVTPKANSSDVYTKTEIDNKFSSIPSTDLSDYYTKLEIDNKGYLTEHLDISNLVVKEEGKSLVDNTLINKLALLDDKTTIDSNIADAKKAGTDALDNIDLHKADLSNPHLVTKNQVGLGNVDNTSDMSKPISTATLAVLDTKYVKPTNGIPLTDLSLGVQSSLSKADTALLEHQSLSEYIKTSEVTTLLDTKVDKVTGKLLSSEDYTTTEKVKLASIESGALVNTITGIKGDNESLYRTGEVNITKANIGLGNVDNTSDLNKPISSATLTALDNKVDKVEGKQLSTNDYTDSEKSKLASLSNYDDTSLLELITTIKNDLNTVVGESATEAIENFNEVKNFLAGITDTTTLEGLLSNLKSEVDTSLSTKVDKVDGKTLSTNDYTTNEKNKLAGIETGALVNTVTGVKGNAESSYRTGNINITPANIGAATTDIVTTSANGLMSIADKTKLDGIAEGALVNVIESISVNGVTQTITTKSVDITVPEIEIATEDEVAAICDSIFV